MTQEREIEKRIYEVYPKTKKEKDCDLYKAKQEYKREALRKKLINEWQREKKVYS